jgi:hypothetical protein
VSLLSSQTSFSEKITRLKYADDRFFFPQTRAPTASLILAGDT